ncbi:MAG: DNA-binding protein [Thermodesulfobacteriota bacterium]
MQPNYMTMRDAAAHCGYAYETFRKMLRAYRLPKYGPKANRFAVHDLDAFMADPGAYKEEPQVRARRSRQRRGILTWQ